MTDHTTNVPDPNDRATLESGRSFELRIRDRERKLLSKIDEALVRIKDGSYGMCEECDEEIGIKRLEARPVTTLCIDCKTLQETKEKSKGQ